MLLLAPLVTPLSSIKCLRPLRECVQHIISGVASKHFQSLSFLKRMDVFIGHFALERCLFLTRQHFSYDIVISVLRNLKNR